MAPRTRTLSFMLVLLSVNNEAFSHILPTKFPTSPDFCTNLKPRNNTKTPSSTAVPELLSTAKWLLGLSQRPYSYEISSQPVKAETPAVSVDQAPLPSLPGVISETPYKPVPQAPLPSLHGVISEAPYKPVPKAALPSLSAIIPEASYNPVVPISLQPEIAPTETISTLDIYVPAYPAQFEYSTQYDPDFAPLGTVPIEPIPMEQLPVESIPMEMSQSVLSPEVLYPESLPFYPNSINVQVPQTPGISASNSVTPNPSMLPQNFPPPNLVPEFNYNLITEQISQVTPVVETSPVVMSSNIGANIVEPVQPYNSQLPFNFQINVPAPHSEPSIILITAPNQVSPSDLNPMSQDYTTALSSPPMIPPPPMIIMERSKSSWKRWLPILLITMLDGGCGNSCCNCGCSGGNIPIPFPIPIPTNNPIILGQVETKKNSTRASGDD